MELNRQGFGLIEVMVSAGISAAIALSSFSMIQQQQKQLVRMDAKYTTLEAQTALATALSDPIVCQNQLASLGSFDVSHAIMGKATAIPAPPTLTKLYLGDPASSSVAAEKGQKLPTLQVGPLVNQIYLSDLIKKSSTDDTLYLGTLYVEFGADSRFKPDLPPMKIGIDFKTSTGGPLTSRSIASCKSNGSGGGGGGAPVPTPSPSAAASGTVTVYAGPGCPPGQTEMMRQWAATSCGSPGGFAAWWVKGCTTSSEWTTSGTPPSCEYNYNTNPKCALMGNCKGSGAICTSSGVAHTMCMTN